MGQVKPTKKQIAAAIGVSPPMVSKYLRQGMPAYSIEAAIRWREQHVNPMRRKEMVAWMRADPAPAPPAPPPPPVDLERITLLFAAARADFDRWADDLRAALRAVPHEQRDKVLLDVQVMSRLLAPALAAVGEALPAESDAAMTDADASFMGSLWYAVAAGEIYPVGDKLHVTPPAHYLLADA